MHLKPPAMASDTLHVLFICGRGISRSPTAERIFAAPGRVETASAGVSRDAETAVCADLIEWADLICVMEPRHRSKLNRAFGRQLRGKRVLCLDIPDDYGFMDPELIGVLLRRLSGILEVPEDVGIAPQGD